MTLLERLAAVTVAREMATMASIAEVADREGYWGVGVSDSPLLYHEMYPTITWLLGRTERIHVGPNVTNPVSRHWTVHASTARTMEDLYPGRFFLGMAAGDGAVHSIGRRPAPRAELESIVDEMRGHMPAGVPIQLAVSGPRMAESAGRVADGLILSTGAEPAALKELGDRARAVAPRRISAWALVYVEAVADPAAVSHRLDAAAPVAMAMSRFSLSSTFESKHVPEDLQPRLRQRMSEYRFEHHAEFNSANPNAHLFDEDPEVFRYLLERFCIVDTPDRCVERLERLMAAADLDGVWLVLDADDPSGTLERLAAAARASAANEPVPTGA